MFERLDLFKKFKEYIPTLLSLSLTLSFFMFAASETKTMTKQKPKMRPARRKACTGWAI